jgi:CRP-like cAMP-binding protein
MVVNQNILEQYGLTKPEIMLTISKYRPETVKANHFFLKQGNVSNGIGFVVSGLLRTFMYDDRANEITTRFHLPGSLIISFDSFNNQIPSQENIVAIENSELMVISYNSQRELYELIPAWNQICKDLADQLSKEMIARAIQFQTLNATERYQRFCKEYPEVIRKSPLRHIASYLGIDIATLSRIRRKG